ncbi:MAG: hypothetical protein ACI90U_000461 [Pseudomonadales bacterium]|jgi:hypothetical protein
MVFLPVPVVITEPAVEGGLGLMGFFSMKMKRQLRAEKRACKVTMLPST